MQESYYQTSEKSEKWLNNLVSSEKSSNFTQFLHKAITDILIYTKIIS